MNITINVDCTPEEARRFMGLPDVAPMQEEMLKKIQDQMMANVTSMQPAELMRAWLPAGFEGWQEMQKSFWSQMMSVGKANDEQT
jgi:hypothetical protein